MREIIYISPFRRNDSVLLSFYRRQRLMFSANFLTTGSKGTRTAAILKIMLQLIVGQRK